MVLSYHHYAIKNTCQAAVPSDTTTTERLVVSSQQSHLPVVQHAALLRPVDLAHRVEKQRARQACGTGTINIDRYFTHQTLQQEPDTQT